jgi:hypothetical protein
MKREAALERLRAGGRLSCGARPANILTEEQADMPLARQISRIVAEGVRAAGTRCLAPSVNHAVLP